MTLRFKLSFDNSFLNFVSHGADFGSFEPGVGEKDITLTSLSRQKKKKNLNLYKFLFSSFLFDCKLLCEFLLVLLTGKLF